MDARVKPAHDENPFLTARENAMPAYFTRAINSMAPAGARTFPSWIT
jgi:hypothetical protein